MRGSRSLALFALLLSASVVLPQAAPELPAYTRLNTFGIVTEYSGNSSHIFLGLSQNRQLFTVGASYSRRVFLNRIAAGQYMIELRPVFFESDPLWRETVTVNSPPPTGSVTTNSTYSQACQPFSTTYAGDYEGVTYSETVTVTCNRRQWTYGQSISPAGFNWNFLPRHRLQPVVTVMGGYLFTARPIPVSDASSANFTFSVGAGFEFYQNATRSIRAEYRLQHISNAGIADDPGIDSQLLQFSYNFGR